MGELEDFIGCMIKRDLTKMTLNICQPDPINRMIRGFNGDMKSLMTFNTPATPYKGVLLNKKIDTKASDDLQKI